MEKVLTIGLEIFLLMSPQVLGILQALVLVAHKESALFCTVEVPILPVPENF